MLVKIEKRILLETAFASLKQAKLENSGDAEVSFYQEAEIRLAEFHPAELNPVALYALHKNLDFQRELRQHLLQEYGVDTLHLSEVLHLRTEQGLVGMIPPYVEISEECLTLIPNEGDHLPPQRQILRLPLLIDGLHRGLLAKEEGETLTSIVVCNLSRTYPYASYPVSWEDVVVGESVPKLKKYYRRQDPYTFMRPLDDLRMLPRSNEYGRK